MHEHMHREGTTCWTTTELHVFCMGWFSTHIWLPSWPQDLNAPGPSPVTFYHTTLLRYFVCVFDCSILLFFFLLSCASPAVLAPQPGSERGPLAVKAQSSNHWTTRGLRVWHFAQSATLLLLPFSCWHLHCTRRWASQEKDLTILSPPAASIAADSIRFGATAQ